MMNSGCIAGCSTDAVKDPMQVSHMKEYQRAQGDAEYLTKLIRERNLSLGSGKSFRFDKSSSFGSERSACSTTQERIARIQNFLRSYPLTTEETNAEKKKKQNCKAFIHTCLKFMLCCVAKLDLHKEKPTTKTCA